MMDTRRRNLIVLGAAALVFIALSAVVLWQRAAEGQPHYTPTEVLPGFSSQVKNAALIHVVSHGGAFDVVYTPDKGWVLPARGNYPADFDEVRHTLIGMAALETIAPKTDRPDWLHYVGLDAPPKGNGVEFTVKDKDGKVLASLITGNTEDIGDPNGSNGLFVRLSGSNQAYLARSVFVPHGEVQTWLPTGGVLTLGSTRLEEVAMTPLSGPAFLVNRPSATEQIFRLANPPKSGAPNSQMVNSIPFSIANFTFEDVKPVSELDFSKPAHAIARTFDGLLVSFDLVKQGDDVWTRLSASTAPGAAPAIAKQAAAINAQTGGYAFKLPAEKGNALMVDLPKIMTPPPPPPQQPAGPPQIEDMGSPGITP
jgi:hypothetical protein